MEIQFLQQEREVEDGKLVTYKEGRYRKEYKRELVNEKHIALWQYRSSVTAIYSMGKLRFPCCMIAVHL